MPKTTKIAKAKNTRWIPRSTVITSQMFRELTQENEQLADELAYATYHLVEMTLRFEKLCKLTHTDPLTVYVDELEIIDTLEHQNPLNHD